MGQPFFSFLIADIIILVAIAACKTLYYKRATKRKSLSNWLYFNEHSIINSSSNEARKFKKIENRLSFLLIVFMIVLVILYFLIVRV